ncbi:hypothetical protein ANCCAN_00535 [Ancylostoma caninum]|uniref:Uncharacterized protein n=1 Tax=Ancylostoma caninum TaxID=29170 RepID=A0A368HCV2_ANCCA|nr:hypothetical protein ANCCAN_00535 [Ancylostoma caninum]
MRASKESKVRTSDSAIVPSRSVKHSIM